jgi:hypothetical protein
LTRPFSIVARTARSARRCDGCASRRATGSHAGDLITEWGWAAGAGGVAHAVPEATLVAYPRAFVVAAAAGVEVLCWFSAQDTVDSPMGLTRNDGTRRDSYHALRTLARSSATTRCQAAGATTPTTGLQACVRAPSGRRLVVWSADGQRIACRGLVGPRGSASTPSDGQWLSRTDRHRPSPSAPLQSTSISRSPMSTWMHASPPLRETTAGPAAPASASRADWVDAAKGIGIVLVVIGHAIDGLMAAHLVDPLGGWPAAYFAIYTFHMPLFFLLAGLFVTPRLAADAGAFVRSAWIRIAWPYLLWSLVQLAVIDAFGAFVNTPSSLDGRRAVSPVVGADIAVLVSAGAVGTAFARRVAASACCAFWP